MLNHAISLKGQTRGDIYFYFFIQISWDNWQEMSWATILDNDLGLLLHFKGNEIRLRLG